MTLFQIFNPVVTGIPRDIQPESVMAKFISSAVGILLAGATIYALFQFIQGALSWISSGGDKGNLESAQGRMTNSVLGLVFVFASWMIYLIILQFLGISPIGANGNIQISLPSLF